MSRGLAWSLEGLPARPPPRLLPPPPALPPPPPPTATQIFTTGTAVVVSPVGSLTYQVRPAAASYLLAFQVRNSGAGKADGVGPAAALGLGPG